MHTRTTADYSPLRGPIMDENGRDVSGRSRQERQEYERAVNARSDMLKTFSSKPDPQHKQNRWADRMSKATGKTFN